MFVLYMGCSYYLHILLIILDYYYKVVTVLFFMGKVENFHPISSIFMAPVQYLGLQLTTCMYVLAINFTKNFLFKDHSVRIMYICIWSVLVKIMNEQRAISVTIDVIIKCTGSQYLYLQFPLFANFSYKTNGEQDPLSWLTPQ